MSAFAAIFSQEAYPAALSALGRMLARLEHRGPHGCDTVSAPGMALGHAHFWTTPEEVGEFQPLTDSAGLLHVAFDGRLDNRGELLSALGLRDDGSLSDAMVTLKAFARWGETCFERFLGPFAAVVYDTTRRRLLVARDVVGDRTAFYCDRGKTVIVASEENAVLAHPEVPDRLDEDRLSAFFSLQVPNDGSTFFSQVKELQPGWMLIADSSGTATRKFAEVAAGPRRWGSTDDEYAEEFRSLLNTAIFCRLRSTAVPSVMMSGGLDSTAVAALTAAKVRAPLRTYTYVFDEFETADERAFTEPMKQRFHLDAVYVAGDGETPFRSGHAAAVNPNTPEETPYRNLVNSIYSSASNRGSYTLLTGVFGDHLYTGSAAWLGSLVQEHRWGDAVAGLRSDLGQNGLRRVLRGQALRQAIGLKGRLRPWLRDDGHWLTDDASRRVSKEQPCGEATSAFAARLATSEAFHAQARIVDLRHPYRDRRIVEWMLQLPAHQLSRGAWTKYVLRNAMKGILPDSVRLRTRQTPVTPLYQRGREAAWSRLQALLFDRRAEWPRYVRPDFIRAFRPDAPSRERDELVFWRCVSFELWRHDAESRANSKSSADADQPIREAVERE